MPKEELHDSKKNNGLRLIHSEDIKEFKDEYISIKLRRVEWLDDTYAWTDHTVCFTAECGGLSLFSFSDRDKANQLFLLMVEGKE
jgi:hypothetical protein